MKYKKQKHRIKAFNKEFKKNKALFVMLLPGIILILLINYLPMAGVFVAFKDMRFYSDNFIINFFKSKWIGFENFKFFINTPDAFTITRNTIGYNLAFIILGNLLALFFAICLNEIMHMKMAKFYQSTMLMPYFISWIVISYIVYGLLSTDLGLVNNSILVPLGKERIAWYTEPRYWPYILFIVNTIKTTGYNTIVYLAAITGISTEYYEAASIDGATKWQQTRYITLPQLSVVITIMILLGVGRIFNADFGLFYQVPMESGALFNVTNVIDTYVYRALRATGDIGMASAAGLYQSLCGFICIMVTNLIIRRYDKDKALF